LDTLQVVLMELVPRVEEHCAATGIVGKSDADERILAFLREQTLRDVLPAAPPTRAWRNGRSDDRCLMLTPPPCQTCARSGGTSRPASGSCPTFGASSTSARSCLSA
jgi:hypothetical protein